MPSRPTPTFPFSAIVGQETLKLALLLNAVDARVGGVLIRGEKGTAKSTAVRALARVLPPLSVVEGCRFSCDPGDPGSWCDECRARRASGPLPKTERPATLVELPVSATEDRIVGTLDLEHALKHGERVFEPGLLARANRSILYVDEVNLLDDHLVDTLLDAAAMGVNTVEREGVSFRHPARFMLVGTMNPEEGDIRPQLLDRFGLCVDVLGVRDPGSRVEIVRRGRDFEEDAESFVRRWSAEETTLRARLKHARLVLPRIEVSDTLLYAIANLALTTGVDGHRADQAMARAAAALAALEGELEVTLAHVGRVAPLVLAHRLRRTLFDEPRLDAGALAALVARTLGDAGNVDDESADDRGEVAPGEGQTSIWDAHGDVTPPTEAPTALTAGLNAQFDRTRRQIAGRRQESVSADRHGRYSHSEPGGDTTAAADVAFDASIRAAAPHQRSRSHDSELAIKIDPSELQRKVRTRKVGATIVFCVDASGSMGAEDRMRSAKTAVIDLLTDAYQRRDRVGLVSFRGERADVVLAPTASVELATMRLRSLPTGGATPLAAGILKAIEVLQSERARSAQTVPWLVLVTDGRGNVGVHGGLGSSDAMAAARQVRDEGVHCVVLDTSPAGRRAAAREIAEAAGAEYVAIKEGDAVTLVTAVRERVLGVR